MIRWSSLRPRDRRALGMGAAILIPALAWSAVVRPFVRGLGEDRARLVEQRGLLERELALVAGAPAQGAEESAANAGRSRLAPRLFEGDALSAATALAGYATESARRNGVLVEEIQSGITAEAGPGLTRVEVATRGRSDLAGVLRWLRTLEAGGKLVRVERLSLERQSDSSPGDSADTEIIALTATLRGYVASDRGSTQ